MSSIVRLLLRLNQILFENKRLHDILSACRDIHLLKKCKLKQVCDVIGHTFEMRLTNQEYLLK